MEALSIRVMWRRLQALGSCGGSKHQGHVEAPSIRVTWRLQVSGSRGGSKHQGHVEAPSIRVTWRLQASGSRGGSKHQGHVEAPSIRVTCRCQASESWGDCSKHQDHGETAPSIRIMGRLLQASGSWGDCSKHQDHMNLTKYLGASSTLLLLDLESLLRSSRFF